MSTEKPALPEPDSGLGVHRNTYSSDLMRSYAEECVRAALAAQAERIEYERSIYTLQRSEFLARIKEVEAERDALRAEVEVLRSCLDQMREWFDGLAETDIARVHVGLLREKIDAARAAKGQG